MPPLATGPFSCLTSPKHRTVKHTKQKLEHNVSRLIRSTASPRLYLEPGCARCLLTESAQRNETRENLAIIFEYGTFKLHEGFRNLSIATYLPLSPSGRWRRCRASSLRLRGEKDLVYLWCNGGQMVLACRWIFDIGVNDTAGRVIGTRAVNPLLALRSACFLATPRNEHW